jgi:glycosyltransferase involved in cell wall biosynthesis
MLPDANHGTEPIWHANEKGSLDVPDDRALSITILINNYNYAAFLARAIESALAQTWPLVQIVVVDDGSTDASPEIAARYSGPDYLFLRKQNGGQNSAIAHGLSHLSGDYTIILDSDDWLVPHACETIMKIAATTAPNALMYRLAKIDNEGRTVGFFPNEPFQAADLRRFISAHGYIPSPPTSGNAYRTDFLKEAMQFVSPSSLFCDGYLAWAAGWTEAVVSIPEVLGCYRVHGRNASTTGGRDRARLYKNNNYALDHVRHLHAWLGARRVSPAAWHELINAYIWRDTLYLKLVEDAYPELPWAVCRRQGTAKFLRARHHGTWKQFKNILFLIAGSRFGEFRDRMRRRQP